jgi:hypothetical protein
MPESFHRRFAQTQTYAVCPIFIEAAGVGFLISEDSCPIYTFKIFWRTIVRIVWRAEIG